MFGRRTSKNSAEGLGQTEVKPGGKGRPTPKRSESEAQRKKRMKPPMDRREAAKRQREQARAERLRTREAMAGSGDQRHLPKRDRGPVRQFARDYVDTRRNVAEYLLPALLLIVLLPVLGTLGLDSRLVEAFTGALWLTTIVLTVLDVFLLQRRVKKELPVRFPDEDTKGATLYAVLRSSQMRWLRLPKPRFKPGEQMPTHYR